MNLADNYFYNSNTAYHYQWYVEVPEDSGSINHGLCITFPANSKAYPSGMVYYLSALLTVEQASAITIASSINGVYHDGTPTVKCLEKVYSDSTTTISTTPAASGLRFTQKLTYNTYDPLYLKLDYTITSKTDAAIPAGTLINLRNIFSVSDWITSDCPAFASLSYSTGSNRNNAYFGATIDSSSALHFITTQTIPASTTLSGAEVFILPIGSSYSFGSLLSAPITLQKDNQQYQKIHKMTYAGWFDGEKYTSDNENCHISIFDHAGDYSVCNISIIAKTTASISELTTTISSFIRSDKLCYIGPAYVSYGEVGIIVVNQYGLALSLYSGKTINSNSLIYCNGSVVGTHLTMYDDSDVDNGYITF